MLFEKNLFIKKIIEASLPLLYLLVSEPVLKRLKLISYKIYKKDEAPSE
jgi:hypothetical protein